MQAILSGLIFRSAINPVTDHRNQRIDDEQQEKQNTDIIIDLHCRIHDSHNHPCYHKHDENRDQDPYRFCGLKPVHSVFIVP